MNLSATAALHSPQRVPELWFDDGTIVIQAGNSLYRVYRGALAGRSSVFRDMLSCPQPPESDLVEGCPFVELPDPEVEVTPFLKAIFDPVFFMPFPAKTEFDAVVGCLRLSNKYEVEYLRHRALVHFSSAYPTTLSKLDALLYRPGECPPLESQSWEVSMEPASRIRAIQLAREVDAPWILPRAFYTLSLNFNTLGVTIFHGAVYNGEKTCLSLEDQTSFLKGYNIQRNDTVDNLRFLLDPLDNQGCHRPGPAGCSLQKSKAMRHCPALLNKRPVNALYVWDGEAWHKLRNMCTPCLEALKKKHQDARQAFWDRLPEIYDLPSWEVLEQLRAAALAPSWNE
ncbi:hypothetical protein MSAN_01243800 [Mycena sanguinolenta]|uniref:BTB domain-containing protein n=1 Tax=Mycena sanguinolenta TaxID=230812 RepID=A0A8H6YIQ8_9AGAR|nr:hypothetical protein MSAN_01243800 [Mycena sanguinolenta]